jgi:chromate transporter
MHRTWGGIVAGALFVLPSLVLLIALSWALRRVRQRARDRGISTA